MKKTLFVVATISLSFVAGVLADKVRDWQDLDKVHDHVFEAIHELERARAANHYDMAGHGEKAEQHLREAERELKQGIAAIRALETK